MQRKRFEKLPNDSVSDKDAEINAILVSLEMFKMSDIEKTSAGKRKEQKITIEP